VLEKEFSSFEVCSQYSVLTKYTHKNLVDLSCPGLHALAWILIFGSSPDGLDGINKRTCWLFGEFAFVGSKA
jgi:hypothetical protein